jgi:eukaryotic-like serine/threonine-protein kinase
LHHLGFVLTASGRAAEAEPLLREALAIREKKLPPGDRLTWRTRLRLGQCIVRLGRLKEGEALMLKSYRELSAIDNLHARRDASDAAVALAEFYASRGRSREAARYRELARATQR